MRVSLGQRKAHVGKRARKGLLGKLMRSPMMMFAKKTSKSPKASAKSPSKGAAGADEKAP